MSMEKPSTYSSAARHFHWWTVAFVAIQFPLGIAMTVRGSWLDIWDPLTNNMYSAHKLLGFILFFVVAARLGYRLSHRVPQDEPTLEAWQKVTSHVTHWAIYALLLLVPILGWFGVQLFPALDIFGWFDLPAVVSANKAASAEVLGLHRLLAILLLFLLAVHVGAALFHYFIRKDGVLHRMLPGLPRRDGS